MLYSAPAALVGTQSVLLSKALAVLLRATAGGDNQFKGWLVCVMVPAFLLSAVLWITRLNRVRVSWVSEGHAVRGAERAAGGAASACLVRAARL